jgi:Ca2+-binding EF-hand superfamily protein
MRLVPSARLLALALIAPWPASGQEPKSPAAVDAQDLVFLGDTRPVLVRLHVHVDGKAVQAVWRDYVRKWFDYLDREGKGYLTRSQVQYAPKAPAFQALRQPGGFFFANPGTTVLPAELGKRLGDDKISFEDLAGYYARAGAGPVQVTAPAGVNNTSQRVSQALFDHLDVNKDGKLSPEELFAAEKLLRKLDADDDEMLSPQELFSSAGGPALPPPQRLPVGPPGPLAASSGFYVIPPGGNAAPLAALLLAHYDKDKNTRLSRAEIGLDRATFERLDVNQDGELDAEELARWHRRPADLELIIRLGKTADGEPAADTYHPEGRAARLGARVTKPADGVLLLSLGDAQLNVLRGAGAALRGGFSFRQFLLEQFRAVDAKGRGYIEREDLKNVQPPLLRQIFTLVDRDGDGRLTEKELEAFLDLQAGAPASFVSLEVLEKGRGLFEILDANRDGLLSVRELRTGWARLAPLDKEGRGFVRMADLPRQFQLRVAGAVPAAGGGAFPGMGSTGRAAPTKGPLWFRKMDRNGDGDVSLREFLGTRADFERIDTDGDGLIDAAEAERADAWFREKLRRAK